LKKKLEQEVRFTVALQQDERSRRLKEKRNSLIAGIANVEVPALAGGRLRPSRVGLSPGPEKNAEPEQGRKKANKGRTEGVSCSTKRLGQKLRSTRGKSHSNEKRM